MIRINLLSDREAIRKETSRQQISVFLLSLCLLLVILGGVQFSLYQKKRAVEEDIQATERALNELREKVGEVEKYKKLKKEFEEKLRLIEILERGKMWIPRSLDSIGQIIPEKVWLNRLSLSGTTLALEGFAVDHETVAQFMRELERSPFFSNVELRLTEKKEVEGVGMKYFSLAMTSDPAQDKSAGPGKPPTEGPRSGAGRGASTSEE